MNMSHYKCTNITNWEPNNMSMDGHLLDHDQYHQIIPFDHTNRSPLLHENHPKPSTSTQTPLLDVPTLHGELDQVGKFDIGTGDQEDAEEELGSTKEMMFKIAAMQPIDIDPTTVRKPKRRNIRISDDPQSIAARHRRERISEKIGILQRIVPGGTKMDTASMLDEAIRYMKFLKREIGILQANPSPPPSVTLTPVEDWAGLAGTSYMFGGNNINNDGTNHHDDPMCFNKKFN